MKTMHKTLLPRDNRDRLHALRIGGGRVFANIEDCADAATERFKDHIKKRK